VGGDVALIRAAAGGLAVCVALTACPKPAPVVQQRTYAVSQGSLRKVAVMPFYPRPELSASTSGGSLSSSEVADLVSTFVTEALAAQGISVVPPSDLITAFTGSGSATPRLDPRAAASTATLKFGASAVLLGEVYRWRDRSGGRRGTSQAASVGYQMTLYQAPSGRRLWSSRFDETQRPITENVMNAPRYPGGGMRWLTAAELARWGAGAAATALASGQ
jgi:hypothetical protein